jgi:hypothetical protein
MARFKKLTPFFPLLTRFSSSCFLVTHLRRETKLSFRSCCCCDCLGASSFHGRFSFFPSHLLSCFLRLFSYAYSHILSSKTLRVFSLSLTRPCCLRQIVPCVLVRKLQLSAVALRPGSIFPSSIYVRSISHKLADVTATARPALCYLFKSVRSIDITNDAFRLRQHTF